MEVGDLVTGPMAPFPPVRGTGPGGLREALSANPFLMAPMAGVTDAAYRLVMRQAGAALAYTEMVSVAGIHYGGDKTWELVEPSAPEPDIAVQLFGSKPDQFREAAAKVAERLGGRLALVDVNMACPVPKVTRKGEGSALLDEPGLAAQILRACQEGLAGTGVPVTCKIRRGRRMGEEVAPDFARDMEQAGACAVAVHGRFAQQLYRGQADWGCVARVAQAVSAPVIGSGDVLTAEDANRMLAETGASAVMVARGSYGNPWIFANALRLRAGQDVVEPTREERLEALWRHVRLLDATHAHLARARSLAGWYLKGFPGASALRDGAMRCVTLEDYRALVERARAWAGEDGDGAAPS